MEHLALDIVVLPSLYLLIPFADQTSSTSALISTIENMPCYSMPPSCLLHFMYPQSISISLLSRCIGDLSTIPLLIDTVQEQRANSNTNNDDVAFNNSSQLCAKVMRDLLIVLTQ